MTTTTTPQATSPQDQTPDLHAGQGGSYTADPVTGARTLVYRAGYAADVAQAAEAAATAAEATASNPATPVQE